MAQDEFRFEGFDSPSYTQVPDAVFDLLMPILSGAEFKVLCYIVRRTFGFKKLEDDISLAQIIGGIKTKDDRALDGGTGLSRDSVTKAIKTLEDKGIISVNRRYSNERGDQPSTYALRFKGSEKSDSPESDFRTPPPREIGLPPVRKSDPQQTVKQQTGEQETDRSNYSNGNDIFMSREDAEQIGWIFRDLASEFADQAPLKSTTTRAQRLYQTSGLKLDDFLDAVQAARLRTKQYTGSIKSEPVSRNGGMAIKPKTAYFFGVLEDFIGVKSGGEKGEG